MSKARRTSEIASWIRGEITSGTFPPGARIEERALCERFNVSKTPVREALIELASRGLVDLRQRRGATVTVLAPEQIVALFEMMTELESMAARLAAKRISTNLMAQLRDIHLRSAELVDDVLEYDRANTALHETIYRAAHNEFLEAGIKDARARLRIYRRYPFQQPGRMTQSYEDHEAIINAIGRGDGAAAARAMRRHLTVGGQVFADLVARLPRKEPVG
ncbi:GntR family transcriptional regulator [Enterovirga aerilata]|uniref:GntR family transcriptional regulator n=1 Tax=Enterovirga aerilata TaxID=2730920 RepID=A0A849IDX1_9HYPH|nr:GntR family transcriptional regulator [Enterovirga sp. DB1703]NNM74177.1 GntR family transcriptional regulator [Enterovirga sp. DB1703]